VTVRRRDDCQSRRYCTAWLGFASQESAFDQTSAGLPADSKPRFAINPVIAHPMLSRGNEVANRTNFVAVHESGIALRATCFVGAMAGAIAARTKTCAAIERRLPAAFNHPVRLA